MTAEKESPKLAAAVSRTAKVPASVSRAAKALGGRGGKQTALLYGKTQYATMARIAHKSKIKRYGADFYVLIRFGFKPKEMTPEQREEALAKIESDRNLRTVK